MIQNYRTQIEDALQYSGGTHNFDDIVHGVERGDFQFWYGPGTALVTEVIQFPQKKVFSIFLAGGNLAEIEAMAPTILSWGRSQGCTSMVFIGRKGWQRCFLKQQGWTVTQEMVVMEATL